MDERIIVEFWRIDGETTREFSSFADAFRFVAEHGAYRVRCGERLIEGRELAHLAAPYIPAPR